jgi:hypothetical protein
MTTSCAERTRAGTNVNTKNDTNMVFSFIRALFEFRPWYRTLGSSQLQEVVFRIQTSGTGKETADYGSDCGGRAVSRETTGSVVGATRHARRLSWSESVPADALASRMRRRGALEDQAGASPGVAKVQRAGGRRSGDLRPGLIFLALNGEMRASPSKSRSMCRTSSPLRIAQAAIRQSMLDLIVTPARRADRYRSTAAENTSGPSGDSTMGSASIDSRARRYAGSELNPCNTSWTTGRHVTMSSKSTTVSI